MKKDRRSTNQYDIIIIGGRCAGASLALRLASNDLKVLLVDRATFPSLPNVPSAPYVHPGTMRLLDELGIPEAEYTHVGAKIERFVLANFENFFLAEMPTSRMKLDRNYFQGIDRCLFDETLWKHAARVPGVVAREGFSVTQILKDEAGTVNGLSGKTAEGIQESFTADLVIGADGRFSFSARQFGAKVVEEQNQFTSATYYAHWENVDDYSPDYPHAMTTYTASQGFMLLVIPVAERKYTIAAVMKSSDAHFGSQVEPAYLEGLQRAPHLWQRLKNARRVTEVIGMRPIENGYREAFGSNWALVGDAVHFEDPSDGQGIYNALLESKLLAAAVLDWKNGTPWAVAGASYQQKMLAATHPTFVKTIANVKQTLYTNIPGFLLKTLLRWMLSNPYFQTQFLRNLARATPPASGRGRVERRESTKSVS